MKCKIQWISAESGWKPTPDDNDAVALVTCDHSTGAGVYSYLRVYPICAEHLAQLHPNWIRVEVEGLEDALARARMQGYERGQRVLAEQIKEVLP